MEKLRNKLKKQTDQPATEQQQSPQIEEEILPRYLAEKLANNEKMSSGLYDPKSLLSVELLRESGLKFRENKNYVISYVLDELKDEYISLKRALRVGILTGNEFVNSKTGDAISIPLAMKMNKIKISEAKDKSTPSLLIEEVVRSVETPAANNNTNYERDVQLQFEISPVSDDSDRVQQQTPETTETHKIPEVTETPEATETQAKAESESRKSSIVTIAELIKSRTHSFNLVDVLLYRKPTNGKYIRFDKVVKNSLYSPETGRIKDLNTNEFITLTEAFTREVVRINDPDVLYDKFNVYKIESVMSTSDKLTLSEAIRKRIVNRRACTYKFLSHTYTIDNAMREGLVEGKERPGGEFLYAGLRYILGWFNFKFSHFLAGHSRTKRIIEP